MSENVRAEFGPPGSTSGPPLRSRADDHDGASNRQERSRQIWRGRVLSFDHPQSPKGSGDVDAVVRGVGTPCERGIDEHEHSCKGHEAQNAQQRDRSRTAQA
jgi:hypothetical protein